MRKFVISDIHGCDKTFQALLNKIELSPKDELYLLGDFVDRGPDSKGVIDTIIRLQKQGFQIECIRGNHEEQMLAGRRDISALAHWWKWGGKETTESFGFQNPKEVHNIPDFYWDWMDKLPYFLEVDNYILVHAGLDFTNADPLNDVYQLIWIRRWYETINYKWLGNRIIVHGHSPVTQEKIQFAAKDTDLQVINVDNGCFKTKEGQGNLCALELTSKQLYFQPCIDEITWRKTPKALR